jgi:putative acyl-CoA dehydrogenase
MATHAVVNQAPPVRGDIATSAALVEGLRREGAEWAEDEVRELGRLASGETGQLWGRLADQHPPVLRTHDRYGNRVDEVDYLPEYHALMRTAVEHGLHASPWLDRRPGVHVARAAKLMAWAVADAGHLCPVSMTYASVPALRVTPELAERYVPGLASTSYDPVLRPPAAKTGLTAGMSMTEKQGGSDVRSNSTRAEPVGAGWYRLTGHKWFTSAPMSDLFLTLAQAPGGLSCFVVPRTLPDGSRNGVHLQRLKDKLGNRSNASAEVEYDGALGELLGEEGRGVRTIIAMVNLTRLDCVLLAAAGMRTGTALALHHATHRRAFGRPLVQQPAMRNVLADLALESEAATAVALRLAGAVDRAARGDPGEAALSRLGLAVSKYFVCKRWSGHAAEALECLGGNGYVEESGLPRLYREAPLVSIWEGSGSVVALDVLRVLGREPQAIEAFDAELGAAAGVDDRYDEALAGLRKHLSARGIAEERARWLTERLALLLQASLLLRHAPTPVAEAFVGSRLGGDHGFAYGTLPPGSVSDAVLDRAAIGD